MQQKVDAIILQAKNSVDDANQATYDYIKLMVLFDHPGLITEKEITQNIDHVSGRFKQLKLML